MKPSILVVGLPLLVGSCASTLSPDVVASTDIEQDLSVKPISYQSPIMGYTPRQPVDPKPWRQQNERQSPQSGGTS